MNIYESLENLQVSEECFNDIMGIVEEILSESEYSVTDVKKKASNALKSRLNKLNKGSQDLNDPEAQRNLSRARRASSILELPNSNRSFKKVQKAADNSLQNRKNKKEYNDKKYTEDKDFFEPYGSVTGKSFEYNAKAKKQIKNDSKRYLKSVGLSSKKGYTHPLNNTSTPIDPSDTSPIARNRLDDKGHKVDMQGGPSYEYQNRHYHV